MSRSIYPACPIALGCILFAVATGGCPSQPPTFFSVEEFRKPDSGFALDGTDFIDPEEWSSLFFTRPQAGDEVCSGTLVGPRVFLTAAHCVASHEKVLIRRNNQPFGGPCGLASESTAGDFDPDLALCELTSEVTGVTYETVNSDATLLEINTQVLLTGFGDSALTPEPRLRKDEATVEELAPPADSSVTVRGSSLCPGDSGGGVFLVSDGDGGVGPLLAIAEEGDCKDGTDSLVTSVTSPLVATFFSEWRDDHPEALICGFEQDPRCRG